VAGSAHHYVVAGAPVESVVATAAVDEIAGGGAADDVSPRRPSEQAGLWSSGSGCRSGGSLAGRGRAGLSVGRSGSRFEQGLMKLEPLLASIEFD
jgi:hypothetical protein